MNRIYLLSAAFMAAASLEAQTVEKTANGVKFSTAQPTLNGEIIFYSPSIVRVVKYPSAQMPEKKSYPVVMTPQEVEISFKQEGDDIIMKTANVMVALDTKTGQVEYSRPDGGKLLSDKP